ncbi:Uma2 family endonuclease [Gemmobacter lutimaris]
MTEPEFATFLQARENRWELLNGQPVMMAPTTQRHANLVANILASLHRQLRGTGCRPTCARTGVGTGETTIRYPDLVVDRGPRVDLAMCATSPTLVIEILSPARDYPPARRPRVARSHLHRNGSGRGDLGNWGRARCRRRVCWA